MATPELKLTDGLDASLDRHEAQCAAAQTRLLELQDRHVIGHYYTLPYPYLSQIYHLLNLKHLETVHSMSLGSLKIVDVCSFQLTPLGGSIKFRTALDSPINLLKIWRSPIADVELTLHTPYMVELSVPVHGEKKMIVIFKIQPLNDTTHDFSIDIYTDLKFPKCLLAFMMHFAILITIYEDLPYLRNLSNKGTGNLVNPARTSESKTMWLFKRFVELYHTQYSVVLEDERDRAPDLA
jgi:hypothetical protein